MPTLMKHAVKKPDIPPVEAASSRAPTSITLSFQGVDFCLEPADANGELSYKHSAADGGIVVSLNSFSGTLKISPNTDGSVSLRHDHSSTAAVTDLARTVEEEPDSPGVVSGKGAKKVSPGQQKISFAGKGKGGNKKTVKKDSRKRTNEDSSIKTPKASSSKTKRTRVTEEKPPQKESERPMALSQQASQEEMPLPIQQTMDSSVAMASETESEQVAAAATTSTTTSILKTDSPKDTVKDILDRVNSTASVNNEEMEEDEVATRMEGDEDGSSAMDDKQDGPTNDINMDVAGTETEFKGYGPPSPRWGHTMTEVNDGKFLVYGGQVRRENLLLTVCMKACPKTFLNSLSSL